MHPSKIILFGISLFLFISTIGYCNEQPLKLTIKSDKQIYKVRKPIYIELKLENIGDKPIWINTDIGFGRNIIFEFKEIEVITVKGFSVPPSKEDFLLLRKGDHYEYTVNLLEGISEELPVGKYTLSVLYRNLYTGNEFGINAWTENITSDPITFEVIDRHPDLAMETKAKVIAEKFLSKQPFKDEYEGRASSTKEYDDFIEVIFRVKKQMRMPSVGIVKVYKNTWKPEWVFLE